LPFVSASTPWDSRSNNSRRYIKWNGVAVIAQYKLEGGEESIEV